MGCFKTSFMEISISNVYYTLSLSDYMQSSSRFHDTNWSILTSWGLTGKIFNDMWMRVGWGGVQKNYFVLDIDSPYVSG